MILISCEINLMLTWSENCVVTNSTGTGKFIIINTKFYVLVITSSTHYNIKLLQQLTSGFKCTTNLHKYQSKVLAQAQNQKLDY